MSDAVLRGRPGARAGESWTLVVRSAVKSTTFWLMAMLRPDMPPSVGLHGFSAGESTPVLVLLVRAVTTSELLRTLRNHWRINRGDLTRNPQQGSLYTTRCPSPREGSAAAWDPAPGSSGLRPARSPKRRPSHLLKDEQQKLLQEFAAGILICFSPEWNSGPARTCSRSCFSSSL